MRTDRDIRSAAVVNIPRFAQLARLTFRIDLGEFGVCGYARRMKRLVSMFVLVCLAGCSNAPIAGFLDTAFPSKLSSSQPDRPRNPVVPGVGPNDRIPPPATDLGGPVGPPAPGN